ncbi:hypothetical protein LTR62_000914 [Meristemomyces frigidus]|uniref:Uncharacterized protein n=1 Tax=Meristemomyces frigidus TaxID=1508187 RepID=A0AAN7YLC8_9PEZI|nr:hypothetical protein LTR62_000914 [Meristemomyces frigidus]
MVGTMTYLLDLCYHRAKDRVPSLVETVLSGHHEATTREKLAQGRAASMGPGSIQCSGPGHDGAAYGPSVLARTKTKPAGDWIQRIRLYREGLASADWKLSPELQQYVPGKQEDQKTFNCPVTVVFGMQDVALDPRIVLGGIERYFLPRTERKEVQIAVGPSHVVELPRSGHWSMLDSDEGKTAIEGIVRCLTADESDFGTRLDRLVGIKVKTI